MNTGSSPYHAIGALYCRGFYGDLLSIDGRAADQIARHWSEFTHLLTTGSQTSKDLPSETQVKTIAINTSNVEGLRVCDALEGHTHAARELYRPDGSYHVGLVSCSVPEDTEAKSAFRDWIETFILLETSLRPCSDASRMEDRKAHQTTEGITALFSATLKNTASNDEWDTGVHLFKRRVMEFVIRDERIQMSLPAFPCKSPNARKVGGDGPDMAERVALRTLQRFAQDVRSIYPPGVAIWIVSDGHVFSDCIGVDDEAVSIYDQNLLNTYRSMFTSGDDRQAIRFRGLTEMFFSNPDSEEAFSSTWISHFKIEHPINSKHSPDAELARQIMMAGFQSSREQFRKMITDQHKQTLELYRGQARFMQDDLAAPDFLEKSLKQRKKISFVVAAEMIARNRAYSNLLELLLPNHVRLSIHAHPNRGPKFGICLFPRDQVRAIDSVPDRHALSPSYEFQVPTPWHNSIIKIEGDNRIYLGKAEIVHKAIQQGDFEGGWVEDHVEGGHFALRPALAVSNASSVATESSSVISTKYADEKGAVVTTSKAGEMLVVDSSLDHSKGRRTIKLRGKVYEFSTLSRFFTSLVTRDKSRMRSSKGVTTLSSS